MPVATPTVPRHNPASSPSSDPAASVTSDSHKRSSTDGLVTTTRVSEGGEEERGEEERGEEERGEEERGEEERMEEELGENRAGTELERKEQRGEEGMQAEAISKPHTPPLTSHNEREQAKDGAPADRHRCHRCGLVHTLVSAESPCPTAPHHESTHGARSARPR